MNRSLNLARSGYRTFSMLQPKPKLMQLNMKRGQSTSSTNGQYSGFTGNIPGGPTSAGIGGVSGGSSYTGPGSSTSKFGEFYDMPELSKDD